MYGTPSSLSVDERTEMLDKNKYASAKGSAAQKIRAGGSMGSIEISAELWITTQSVGMTIYSKKRPRLLPEWDQVLSLLWLKTQEVAMISVTRGKMMAD